MRRSMNRIENINNTISVKQDDTGTVVQLKIYDYDGNPVDLKNPDIDKIEVKIGAIGRGFHTIKIPTLLDETGALEFRLDVDDKVPAGKNDVEVHVYYKNGRKRIFPAEDAYKLKVSKSLDAVGKEVFKVTVDYLLEQFDNKKKEIEDEAAALREEIENAIQYVDESITEVRQEFNEQLDQTVDNKMTPFVEVVNEQLAQVERNKVDKEIVEKITSELEDKADINKVRLVSNPITPNDLAESTLQLITGNANISVKSEPKMKSVSLKETVFLDSGKNLFNKDLVKGGTSQNVSTGAEFDSVDHSLSEPIPVISGETYTQTHQFAITFWDADGNFISGIPQAMPFAVVNSFTVPENAVVAKVSVVNNYLDTYQLQRGSEFTGYEKFKYKIKRLEVERDNLAEKSVTEDKVDDKAITVKKLNIFEKTHNLFNKNDITEGTSINKNNGNLLLNENYYSSGFIEIDPNTAYSSDFATRWATYDADKKFISSGTEFPFVTESNAKYIRISGLLVDIDKTQINEGTSVLEYEPWGYKLKSTDEEHPFFIDESLFPDFENNPKLKELKTKVKNIESEQNDFGLDPKPLGTFTSEVIAGAGANDSFVLENTVHTDVYSWYDELVASHPNYVTKKLLGIDGLGNEIYMYHFKDADWIAYSDVTYDNLSFPKILTFTGTHGQEKVSTYAQFNAFRQLVNNWKNDEHLEYLRWNAEFIVVPVVCPSGYDANTRKNHNGVDINRNFEPDWKLTDPQSNVYGGPHPLSERESQIINDLLHEHLDALCVIDYHSFYKNFEPNDDMFIWAIWGHRKVGNAARNMIRSITRKWRDKYEFMTTDEQRMIGYTSSVGGTATIKDQAKMLGLKSCTFETCERMWLESSASGGYIRNSTVNTLSVEAYINFLVSLLYNLTR